MRNFIVAFMILILFSSIMFVMLRPVNNQTEKKQLKEKSHVEKLLTEPAKYNQKEDNEIFNSEEKEIREIREPEKIITDMFKEEVQFTKEDEDIKTNSQQIDKNEKKVIKQFTDSTQSNANYQSVTKELIEKYGNNPNAEVSEEDVQKFMIKMLKTATPQQ